jgi:hypothetical protein
MKRSTQRSTLSPEQAAWLAQTIERNRKYAGLRMMADEGGEGGATDADKGKDSDADKADDDKPLGEGGERALKAERERVKAAEDANKALKSEFDGFKSALLEGLGIKPKDGDDGKDALATVQEQLAAMQHKSSVLELANAHKITDKDDLELLGTAKDPEAMKKLAERLAPAEVDPGAKSGSRRGPKPDRTQGGGDGSGAPAGGSIAAKREELEAARAAKRNKTNS